eukprot:387524_1
MGALCSCCSRRADAIQTDINEDDETEAMLNASSTTPVTKQENITTLTSLKNEEEKQLSPIAGYGSVDDVQYTKLKNDKHTTKKLESVHKSFEQNKFNENIINHDKNTKNKNNNKMDDDDDGVTVEAEEEDIDNDKEEEMDPDDIAHRIPISQHNLVISNAGFNEINGDYRWFLHSSKWCLFR